jgi:hypothetical protein
MEMQQTELRRPRGRKDHDGQGAVVKLEPVRERIVYLVGLYRDSEAASTVLAEGIKDIAEKAGLQASVVRKFIAAKAGEKFAEKKRDCEQLSLLFKEVGE